MKKLILSAAVALCASSAFAGIEDVRIYINPGHGSWTSNDRPCGTVKHGANNPSAEGSDTTNFYESNTNLQKGLALLGKLVEYGVPFDHTKNQTNSNPARVGAALDLTQNIVMSHVKAGPYPTIKMGADASLANAYNRNLSEICAEVEFNNFDVFISIHSNAATEGTNTNFPLILYRGTDTQEGNIGSTAIGKAVWPHLFGLGHQQWTSYSLTSTNIRGDITFYGSQGTNRYPITDPNYEYDESDNLSELLPGADEAVDTVAYTGYLGVLRHGVPGFLAEGYFHTYQPARHRYMNWGVCHLEGEAYAKGLNDYFGWGKEETTGTIYGVVRDMHEKFSHDYYKPNVSTNDKYLPLNNATVTLLKDGNVVATYNTGDEYNGVFIFNDVEPGTYSLNYACDTYEAALEEYTAEFEVVAGGMYFPEAFLENEAYIPPAISYVNYPDSTAGKTGFNVFPNYEVKASEISLLATQLEGKKVRRQLIREDKLYVLALDAANEPYIYLADLANDTVMTLDTKAIALGTKGILKVSDIALTADHYLIACGMSEVDYDPNGTVNVYKWAKNDSTSLPEACEHWLTLDYSANFTLGVAGNSMVYTGTTADGKITLPVKHGTKTSAIAMRMARYTIVDGAVVGSGELLDTWAGGYNETVNKYFYHDNLTTDDRYEMMVSPRNEDYMFIDGNLSTPMEFYFVKTGRTFPATIERNETFVNPAVNGANFFKYAGKDFMVAPKVNEEGKVCGIQMFDITEGISKAKEIVLVGGEIEPAEFTYASAHGELALTLSAEDVTTGADIELFLVVDGKVYKFTETETYTTYNPAEGGTANPFAYALTSEVIEGKTLKVNYSLNADATDVTIIIRNADGEEAATSSEGAQVKGAYSTEISIDGLEAGEYTWEIEVAGAEKTAVETFKSYMFYHPRGVDVDNNMESRSFGNIYCTEGMTSASEDYISNTTTSGGLGLYAFTADMEPIVNQATNKYGFNGGWTLDYKIGSSNAADLARVRVAEDGRIFVTRMSGQGNYIMYAPSFEDLAENNKFTSLFEGLTLDAATYKYSDANGNFMGAANLGFDIKGAGDDLKMIALSSNANHWSYVYSGGSTDEYALGNAATLPVPTNVPALTGKYTIAPASTNVTYDDVNGGIWYCQYRGTPTATQPGLVYINAEGKEVYKDLVSRGGGGVRVSPDGTQIAVASSSANPKQFTIYNLVWSEDGVPALRREYVITHNIGTNVYDIAWDLAGNIYICGNSGEYLKGFALPRSKAFTTKAAHRHSFQVSDSGVVGIESIEGNTAAPVYYNLQGIKVANPENGIYIVKRGNKVTKEYVAK